MSIDRIDRLRTWHEDTSTELHGQGDLDVDYLGLRLLVPAGVFGPTPVSDLLGRCVTDAVRVGDRVLDMGCGAGANALLAARTADDVVAVDINSLAVEATAANAARNGLHARVRCSVSDMFDDVDGSFDVVVIDPPFRWFAPRDMLERAVTDENYEALRRFFDRVLEHLRLDGQVLLFFGTSGDVAYLDELIAATALSQEVIAERVRRVRGEDTHYFVKRLTRA